MVLQDFILIKVHFVVAGFESNPSPLVPHTQVTIHFSVRDWHIASFAEFPTGVKQKKARENHLISLWVCRLWEVGRSIYLWSFGSWLRYCCSQPQGQLVHPSSYVGNPPPFLTRWMKHLPHHHTCANNSAGLASPYRGLCQQAVTLKHCFQ